MTADGMGWGSWLLPPAEHTRAISLIEGEQQKVFTEARAAGTRDSVENHAAQAPGRVFDRAGEQRSGQTTAASGTDPSSATGPVGEDWSFAKLLVTVDLTALDRGHVEPGERCEVAGQGPIPVADVWKMIDGDAFIAAISTRGTEISKVVHLGRRPTVLQKTALEYLSGGVCSIEGCTSRARLETDHVADWAATRRTELAELAPACGHHHDLKTHHGHRFGPLQPNGKRQLIPPDQPAGVRPPELSVVEEPEPPPSISRPPGPDEPPAQAQPPPTPGGLEERARTIGRRNQRTLFDTG
jgi:hypothetical protein